VSVAKVIIVLWSLLILWNWVSGMHNIGSSNELGLVMAFIINAFLWGIVVVPTALIGMLFKKASSNG
jgi:hypothetical protein